MDQLTADAIAISFDVPDDKREIFRFIQGQHISLSRVDGGDGKRRGYSICSPATGSELRVAIKLIPGGVFSSYVYNELAVGDELDVVSPSGRFFTRLDPAQVKDYVAIAVGSGITPILSILATTLEVEPESTFTLLYGNRTSGSMMFLEELNDLKNRFLNRFTLLHVFSREGQEAELFRGRIDGEKLGVFLSTLIDAPSTDEWFLCGPQAMVEELRSVLLERDVEPRRIHRELFHAGPTAPSATPASASGQVCEVTVVLDGRSSTFPLAQDGESILDAALAVRSDAPFACKGGVCGTCRAFLVDGEVRVDGGYALEEDEIEAGFVLACQSHPQSAEVTLDFDR
jgi:ring-1,2-phenylacetyl-CoA epoxidase subunit PaaE